MINTQQELYGLPHQAVKKICAVFKHHAEVESVVLYGSRAKGTAQWCSDIDLCVIAPGLSISVLFKIINELDELLLPWKIDICLKHQIDNPALLQHIEQVGLNFYVKCY